MFFFSRHLYKFRRVNVYCIHGLSVAAKRVLLSVFLFLLLHFTLLTLNLGYSIYKSVFSYTSLAPLPPNPPPTHPQPNQRKNRKKKKWILGIY